MSRNTELAACALALVVSAACGSADARSTDRAQPMDIEAAHSDCGLGANASCTLTGNVTIVQGTLHVTAAKAVVQQSGGNPSRALLSGGVTLQQDMDDGDRLDATSSNIDYDMRNEVMVFTGNVVIRQQRGSLNGERVVYNMKTGQVESGGDGSGRVKMRILPKDTQAAGKGTP
ncbi:lipopolysaccharide transport periplasmic protein LptA [Thermomonas paludicola]|uniref:lipopolysaccharide transport periplasmic protein LptA n=1 Tax=Thermomonas paludicola TaxID=2884874 RepID=UPI0021151C01|nr:lipopolysaccharide transport periplasmic protein LptA [Thermomonas paludicola]